MTKRKRISRAAIRKLRGKFKGMSRGKPFSKWWAEYKREEKDLEEKKLQRLAALGKPSH